MKWKKNWHCSVTTDPTVVSVKNFKLQSNEKIILINIINQVAWYSNSKT